MHHEEQHHKQLWWRGCLKQFLCARPSRLSRLSKFVLSMLSPSKQLIKVAFTLLIVLLDFGCSLHGSISEKYHLIAVFQVSIIVIVIRAFYRLRLICRRVARTRQSGWRKGRRGNLYRKRREKEREIERDGADIKVGWDKGGRRREEEERRRRKLI